jgi:hypothetical protein
MSCLPCMVRQGVDVHPLPKEEGRRYLGTLALVEFVRSK